jgi:hypothetical protein
VCNSSQVGAHGRDENIVVGHDATGTRRGLAEGNRFGLVAISVSVDAADIQIADFQVLRRDISQRAPIDRAYVFER